MSKNIHRVPHYLKAISPEKLTEEMHRNNLKHDQEFGYFDIQREGSFWIAWYYNSTPFREVPIPKEEIVPPTPSKKRK